MTAAAKSARINARLPAEATRKVAYLERRTGKSTTEVVLTSIDNYYAVLTAEEGSAASVLAEAGFVGCAEGPEDLSRSYKTELAVSLGKKS